MKSSFDPSNRRVIAVITLMVLAAWALRGYVPGGPAPDDPTQRPESNPAAFAAVLVLVCAAVAVIGFAILTRMRSPRPARTPGGDLPRSAGGGGRLSWRFAVIALAVIVVWLLLVMVLSRLVDPGPIEVPTSTPSESAEPGSPTQTDAPAPEIEEETSGSDLVNYLIPPMLLLLVLVMVGTAVSSRRQQRSAEAVAEPTDEPAQTPAATTSLARAAEIGLAEIGDLSREPREAIIACYAAMERELTRVPGAVPQDFDTPTEVLARAVDSGALRADSATELVELFEEARFSPHIMSEAHRDAAVQVLHRVLAELPQRSPEAAR